MNGVEQLVPRLDLALHELRRLAPDVAQRVEAYIALAHPTVTLATLRPVPSTDPLRAGVAWRPPRPCLVREVRYAAPAVEVVIDFDVVHRRDEIVQPRMMLLVPHHAVLEVRVPAHVREVTVYGHFLAA